MSAIITVENLGKKYMLRHRDRVPYQTLRDAITQWGKDTLRRLAHPLEGWSEDKREDFWALRDINFSVEQGDRIGIIGRNGSGNLLCSKFSAGSPIPQPGLPALKDVSPVYWKSGSDFIRSYPGERTSFSTARSWV